MPDEYADRLVFEGLLLQEDIQEISNTYTKELNEALKRTETFKPMVYFLLNKLLSQQIRYCIRVFSNFLYASDQL